MFIASALLLSACGGGGGSNDGPKFQPKFSSSSATFSSSSSSITSSSSSSSSSVAQEPSASGWIKDQYLEDDNFYYSLCENPRSGINPQTNQPYKDIQGSVLDENNNIRELTNLYYLWYKETVDRDPGLYSSVEQYFESRRSPTKLNNGEFKDRYMWLQDAATLDAEMLEGSIFGYGMYLALTDNGQIRVTRTDLFSPASKAGITRGDTLVSADGIEFNHDMSSTQWNTILDALFPIDTSTTHHFTFTKVGGKTLNLSLQGSNVATSAVSEVYSYALNGGGTLAYVEFNDHIATAEYELIDSFEWLVEQNARGLILDLRYNGGGYLDIANELAYMIGGKYVRNKTFSKIKFNDRFGNNNPFSSESTTTLFTDKAFGFTNLVDKGYPLPTLNLSEVYIIVGKNTCSASESVINSLKGAGLNVFLIGQPTCGKPYGGYIESNCGTSFFYPQFQTFNHKGFGDYQDGLKPVISPNLLKDDEFKGCIVEDDLDNLLGDFNEKRMNAAVSLWETGHCPSDSLTSSYAKLPKNDHLASPRGDIKIMSRDQRTDAILRRPSEN